MTRNQQEAIEYLNWKKICYGFKTTYANGVAVKTEFMPVTVTKTDKFFRAGGKIIGHQFAKLLCREGMGVFEQVS